MARAPSPHSGRSSLQLPDTPNGGHRQTDVLELDGYDNDDGNDSNNPYYPYPKWRSHDPRSSSTQSLLPSLSDNERRRTLLVVYIHGFMGNDSSFRSFPAHLHSLLRQALAKTHVIHTKVYPRYKTYKAIDVARDNFSKWLEPHESPTTDVILIGHSMGGLLAADIALLPPYGVASGPPFRHRILGTISMDAPLLGLHPGIVVSGIASLFRPAATPAAVDGTNESRQSSATPTGRISPDPNIYSEVAPPSGAISPTSPFPPPPDADRPVQDPYFNPPFFNDVSFIDRGWFKNIANFAKKHKEENLVEAAASHILNHLEFGGCLANYSELNARYNKLRKLEDVDEAMLLANGQRAVRVRFVNYYTASTGIPKATKPLPSDAYLKPPETRLPIDGGPTEVESRTSTPRISIEDYGDGGRPTLLQELEPVPEPDEHDPAPQQPPPGGSATEEDDSMEPVVDETSVTIAGEVLKLPPIPDSPSPPDDPDLDSYTDKDARKQAEKEAKRVKKAYDQAVKNREKTIKERQKLIEKWHRKSLKEAEKRSKEGEKGHQKRGKAEQKQLHKEGKELHKELDALRLHEDQHGTDDRQVGAQRQLSPTQPPAEKKRKERKFCMLPSKSKGARDPVWVRVYMEGVDEVGAHCGLFFPGPHYDKLVGDVGVRIMDWVKDDAARRARVEAS